MYIAYRGHSPYVFWSRRNKQVFSTSNSDSMSKFTYIFEFWSICLRLGQHIKMFMLKISFKDPFMGLELFSVWPWQWLSPKHLNQFTRTTKTMYEHNIMFFWGMSADTCGRFWRGWGKLWKVFESMLRATIAISLEAFGKIPRGENKLKT